MKCMPPLISLDKAAGVSADTPFNIVCENGVCRIDGNVTATTTAAANAANDTIKNIMEEFAENVKID